MPPGSRISGSPPNSGPPPLSRTGSGTFFQRECDKIFKLMSGVNASHKTNLTLHRGHLENLLAYRAHLIGHQTEIHLNSPNIADIKELVEFCDGNGSFGRATEIITKLKLKTAEVRMFKLAVIYAACMLLRDHQRPVITIRDKFLSAMLGKKPKMLECDPALLPLLDNMADGSLSAKDIPLILEIADMLPSLGGFDVSIGFALEIQSQYLAKFIDLCSKTGADPMSVYGSCVTIGKGITDPSLLDLVTGLGRGLDMVDEATRMVGNFILEDGDKIKLLPYLKQMEEKGIFPEYFGDDRLESENKALVYDFLVYLKKAGFERDHIIGAIDAFVRLKAAGFPPISEAVEHVRTRGNMELPDIKGVISKIRAGGFDVKDPLHLSACYGIYNEMASTSAAIKTDPSLAEFRAMVNRYKSGASASDPAIVNPSHMAQLIYLAYEAHLLKEFLFKLKKKADALGKELVVVQNLSYGMIAVSPILEELEAAGIKVISARVGSTECHDNPDYRNKYIFSKDDEDFIRENRPLVAVVDGSNSLSDPKREPHIPDAYIGYRNFPLFKENYPPILFWYPGKKPLVVREYRKAVAQPLPVDPEKIEGPALIFIQSAMEKEAVPQEITGKVGIRHKAADFDDTDSFVDAAFDLSSSGPVYSNMFRHAARLAYLDIFGGEKVDDKPANGNGEVLSFKQMGFTSQEQAALVESVMDIVKRSQEKSANDGDIRWHGYFTISSIRRLIRLFSPSWKAPVEKRAEHPMDDMFVRKYRPDYEKFQRGEIPLAELFYKIFTGETGQQMDFSKIAELPEEVRKQFVPQKDQPTNL